MPYDTSTERVINFLCELGSVGKYVKGHYVYIVLCKLDKPARLRSAVTYECSLKNEGRDIYYSANNGTKNVEVKYLNILDKPTAVKGLLLQHNIS